jgi:hypothetical protein
MQTSENLPPPPPNPGQVTITTVGPNGKTQTISAPEAGTAQPALAPVAVFEREHLLTAKLVSLGMVGTFIVLLPMSIAMAIRMIRRPMRTQNQMGPGADERLTRLEQSIDAIAIEMERVSEGQRYVTKLLAREELPSRQS